MGDQVPDLEELPWRKFEYTLSTLKEEVCSFQPLEDFLDGEAVFPQVNILLLGSIGSGKSSVFNTWNSAIREKMFNIARSGLASQSLTTKFSRYPIMSKGTTKTTPLKFRICDIRGLEPEHLMSRDNMRYILEGNIPDKYQFDPSGTISKDMPGFKENTKLHEKIHCVAIVVDATIGEVEEAQSDIMKNIKEMQNVMNNFDVPQVVILTKIDQVSQEVHKDVSKAFHSKKIKQCVALVSELYGVQKHSIFPMKNYESELSNNDHIDTMALGTLKAILNHCDAYLSNHLDEIKISYKVVRWSNLRTNGMMLVFYTLCTIYVCYVISLII